jgi:hypothetical protein
MSNTDTNLYIDVILNKYVQIYLYYRRYVYSTIWWRRDIHQCILSSTNKTDRHDIAEILLKVTLNTINPKHKLKSTRIDDSLITYLRTYRYPFCSWHSKHNTENNTRWATGTPINIHRTKTNTLKTQHRKQQSCVWCPMLYVYLNCSFLIAPAVFSHVYVFIYKPNRVQYNYRVVHS